MAVLALGNIDFVEDTEREGASVVQSSAPVMHVGLLCGVDPMSLASRLTAASLHVRGESVRRLLATHSHQQRFISGGGGHHHHTHTHTHTLSLSLSLS